MKPFVFAAVPLMCLVSIPALTGPARAQGAPPVAPSPAGESFESQFRRLFDGQPVAAVWPAFGHAYEGGPVQPGTKLLFTLQAFGEAFSTPEDHLIPFAVRNLWVLAPETRTDLNMDFRGYSPWDALTHNQALRMFLLSLSRQDIRALGMADGAPISVLSPTPRAYLTALLGRPMLLQADAGGEPMPMPNGFDPRTARMRVLLRPVTPVMRIETRVDAGNTVSSVPLLVDRAPRPALVPGPTGSASPFEAVNLPRTVTVKNALKPSDLDGIRFRQPFGAKGSLSISEAVKRLQEVTGLEMIAGRQFRDYRLYLGNDDQTCGDVMDALRLGLAAAWRKVGPAYVLSWDRRPTSHLLEESEAASAHIARAVQEAQMDTHSHVNWLMLAEEVPFAPDDPYRWSPEQRARLFGPVALPGDSPFEKREPVRFEQFTPEQQAAVRKELLGRTRFITTGTESESTSVLLKGTEEELASVVLSASASVDVSILVPDTGWVSLPGASGVELVQSTLDHIRYTARIREEGLRQAAAKKPANKWVMEARPFTPDADTRGVMLGPLPPARLKALAPALKKSGINAVFYPALTNGFATFPSKAFPLHPSLGGADGLAAAVREMSAQGIPVIACVEALTWRRNDHPDHWMAKHPDWLDVDRYGRTPLQWLEATIPARERPAARAQVRGNVVRITEPEVARRLDLLMGEVARLPGLSGACLVDWRPCLGAVRVSTTVAPSGGDWARVVGADGRDTRYFAYLRLPELGFALADRLASLRQSGIDPVDVPPANARMPQIRLATPPRLVERSPTGITRPDVPDQRYLHFANRLLERLRKANPGLPTWAVAESGATRNEVRPAAQTVLSLMAQGSPSDHPVVLFQLPDSNAEGGMDDPFSSLPPIVRTSTPRYGRQRRQAIVYDFRDRPKELDGALEYLVLPGTIPAGQQPYGWRKPDGSDPGGEPAATAPERMDR